MWEKAKEALATIGAGLLLLAMAVAGLYSSTNAVSPEGPAEASVLRVLMDPGRHVICVYLAGDGIICGTASRRYAYLHATTGVVEFGTVPTEDPSADDPLPEPLTVPYAKPLTLGGTVKVRMDREGVTAWSTVTGSGFYVDDDRLVRGTKSGDGSYRIGPHVAGCLKDAPCRTRPAAVLSGP
jgi:hypothetical protein